MPPPPETFHKIKYISEPYHPAVEVNKHGESKGGTRQMLGGKGIKSKFIRLYEGEPPKHPRGVVVTKVVKRSKCLTSEGFRFPSTESETNNRGGYDGTFTKKYAHIPNQTPATDEKQTNRRNNLASAANKPSRNITASPSRDETFNKILYISPSVEGKEPLPKYVKNNVVNPPLVFRRSSPLFTKLSYVSPEPTKSKSVDDAEKGKSHNSYNAGNFRPSSSSVNFRAPVTGTFSSTTHSPDLYNEKTLRRAVTPDRLHPLSKKYKNWVS